MLARPPANERVPPMSANCPPAAARPFRPADRPGAMAGGGVVLTRASALNVVGWGGCGWGGGRLAVGWRLLAAALERCSVPPLSPPLLPIAGRVRGAADLVRAAPCWLSAARGLLLLLPAPAGRLHAPRAPSLVPSSPPLCSPSRRCSPLPPLPACCTQVRHGGGPHRVRGRPPLRLRHRESKSKRQWLTNAASASAPPYACACDGGVTSLRPPSMLPSAALPAHDPPIRCRASRAAWRRSRSFSTRSEEEEEPA